MRGSLLFPGIFIIALLGWSCSDRREPLAVQTHPAGWMDPASPNFHGKVLVFDSSLTLRSCRSCHGRDYRGGDSKVSCYQSGCHRGYPHPEGFAVTTRSRFHAFYIAEELLWNIRACQRCHGMDYAGNGVARKNCRQCHTAAEGPEACNTCHGKFEAAVPPLWNAAPPEDLGGHVLSTALGVGAHQHHLTDTTLTTYVRRDCRPCHIQPRTLVSVGHIDNVPLPAEVVFNAFASDSGRIQPLWNREEATCSNIYCHGAFVFYRDSSRYSAFYVDSIIQGNNPSLRWNRLEEGPRDCGTCHDMPPRGHLPVSATGCVNCHPRVVDADLNIVGRDLHINGKADAF